MKFLVTSILKYYKLYSEIKVLYLWVYFFGIYFGYQFQQIW